jgi:hypothetical protein
MPNMIEKITIGVADLFYTEPGGTTEIYLGLTKGGGEFNYETEWHDVDGIDQYGKTAVDSILIGEKASYKTTVVDTSLKSIKRVAPTATELKDNTNEVKALGFGQRPGLRMQNVAGKLRIHPIAAGINDRTRDIIIYKAGSKAKLSLSFKLEEEWVVPCEWNAYPDENRAIGDNMFRIGDPNVSGGNTQRMVQFYLTPLNPSTELGTDVTFVAHAVYEDGTTEDVTDQCTWTSSLITIGTITSINDANPGVFSPVASGTCVVTAQIGAYTTSTTVSVNE